MTQHVDITATPSAPDNPPQSNQSQYLPSSPPSSQAAPVLPWSPDVATLNMFQSLDNTPATYAQAESILTSAGVDTSDPAIQNLLNNESARMTILDPQISGLFIGGLARRYPRDPTTAQYYHLADTYGLTETQVTPADPTSINFPLLGQVDLPLSFTQTQVPRAGDGGDFHTDESSGATIFKNGVIVDPQGQVVMPPGKAVPGSMPWLQEITRNWSQSEVSSWRKKLVDFGYLPKGSEKQKGWSVELRAALVNFHHARYLNGGKPIKSEKLDVAAQPTQLGPLRPVIEEEVRKQLAGTLGQLPGEAEVKKWTDFIVHQGMALQRQKQLTPSTALQVAESRAGNQVYNSPAGQYAVGVEENTSLADALHNAVMVTQGLA